MTFKTYKNDFSCFLMSLYTHKIQEHESGRSCIALSVLAETCRVRRIKLTKSINPINIICPIRHFVNYLKASLQIPTHLLLSLNFTCPYIYKYISNCQFLLQSHFKSITKLLQKHQPESKSKQLNNSQTQLTEKQRTTLLRDIRCSKGGKRKGNFDFSFCLNCSRQNKVQY